MVSATVRDLFARLKRRRHEVLRFMAVGSLGFLVNAVMLTLLHKAAGLPILPAQLLSAETALLHNFLWHHHWTYREYQGMGWGGRLARFHASAWFGLLINTATVTLAVAVFELHYLVALVCGAAAAFSWNLLANIKFIWKRAAA